MRITDIAIDGFGCHSNLRVEVAPGLHIFHGPNEAGKSHLQQAILALLYRFYERDHARASENARRDALSPWKGDAYSGRLEYLVERTSTRYRVERDFSTSDLPTRLWDLSTGRDVTDVYGRGRHGNVPFMRKQLGMSKRVFSACAFVTHGELFQAAEEDLPGHIVDTIVNLADTAAPDVSAQQAIERLQKAITDQIGAPRARTAPLPTARQELDRLKAELANIEAVREDLAEDANELQKLEHEVGSVRDGLLRTRFFLLQSDADDLEECLTQVDILDRDAARWQQVVKEHDAHAAFPVETRDDVLGKWTTIANLREAVTKDQTEVAQLRRDLADVAAKLEALIAKLSEVVHLQDYPANDAEAIEKLAQSWRTARGVHAAAEERLRAADPAEGLLEEYGNLQAEVGNLTPDRLAILIEQLKSPGRTPAANVFGKVGRAVWSAIRWLYRAVVALFRFLLRKVSVKAIHQDETPADAAAQVSPAHAQDAAAIIERHARYLELAPAVQRHRDAEEAFKVSRQQLAMPNYASGMPYKRW